MCQYGKESANIGRRKKMPNVDYSDIDNLESEQNRNLEQQQQLNNKIADTSLNQNLNRLEKQKNEQEKEATKEASGLYTNYKKQSQQFGANQEQLVAQGLGKSGYSESSKVNLYNQYQSNITEVMNKNNELKAEIDLQMNEAYQNADIQKAQNNLAMYQQKLQLLSQNYQLRYQKYRDAVADEQWEKSFALQQQQAQQSQSNWEREYALSLAQSSRQK